MQLLWTTKKTHEWVLEQINPEFSQEANMTKLRLLYLGHEKTRATEEDPT